MNNGGEAADQMVREALQVTEVAIKLSALGIKNALALSLAYAKENPKVKGKTSLDRLLREGKELKIIALQSKDVGQFKELAKQYGVLFAVIKDKAQNEKVDVMFNSRKFAEMTSRDEMFLPRMGLEQRALFIVLPDNDTTFNFIATMLYTQLFDQLFRLADSTPEYNGALPVHVRLMMDEFANVALPKNFKNILAVCRSRNISCDIILQNIAQLKSLFKDDWEGIIGNCDTLLYLGGNEYGTYEYLSKILGKETERTKSQSIGKGSRGSSSDSLQTAGRELCMPDEIRRMRDDECLLLMRSEDPVIDKKYNLLHHPNVKYTPDAGGEPYVMPPDYMGDAVTITMDAVAAATAPEITEEMYEQLDYLEKHPEENYYENEENFSQYDQGD